jgi:anti-sigma factor RsiW
VSGQGLTCKELVELVTDYLEGRLSAADRERFDEHLALCEGCVAYVEQMRALIDALGRLPEPELPAHLEADLLEAFRDWRTPRP